MSRLTSHQTSSRVRLGSHDKPRNQCGNLSKLTEKDKEKLSESAFAFPKERKEPLVDATHVREAIARFDQVQDVTNRERDEAWKRIKKAAEKFDVELHEKDWRDLFTRNGRSIPKE